MRNRSFLDGIESVLLGHINLKSLDEVSEIWRFPEAETTKSFSLKAIRWRPRRGTTREWQITGHVCLGVVHFCRQNGDCRSIDMVLDSVSHLV